MGWTIRNKMEGLPAVLGRLARFKQSMANKVLRRAVAEASRIVLKAMKPEVPVQSGLYKKSLGRKVKVYRNTNVVVGIIGPRTGFKYRVQVEHKPGAFAAFFGAKSTYTVLRNPTKYAHLLEFGVKPHTIGKGSSLRKKKQGGAGHPGFAAMKPLGKAWSAVEGQAKAALVAKILEEIEKV